MATLTKRILRTLVALCLVAVLCVGTLQVSATSQTTITYLALGDSITAGYGLTNPSTEGFVAKFADAISGTDTSVITVNAGESGLTADALVTALASGSYDTQLAAADVITLTIGGNDLMAAFYETVATLYTASENSGTTYTSQDVQTWLSAPTSYSTEVSTIISLISTDSGKATLTAAVGVAATACVTDIEAIVGLIRAANTDAVILLANQYNPYTVLSSIPTYSTISTLFATATSSFNTLLAANTTIASNCTIVDLYNAGVSTNVNLLTMNLDFHPNATGHTTIANAMATAYVTATTPVISADYVTVGTAELHDGYYTTDGVTIATTIPTDNYAYYKDGVLYLKNFTYAATSGEGISSSNYTLTIDLCDSSSSISAGDIGVYSAGDLTVTNGSLVVSAEYGIAVTNGDVVISDCTSVTVLATGGYGIIARNYNDTNHSITISDSIVNVTATTANGGNMAGIVATGDVNISGSTVSVTVDCEEVMGAIWSMGGNISITDESTVTAEATAETYNGGAISAMWSETGNITISKSEVTASSVCTNSTAVNYGAIYTEGNISIMDSTVTAEAISTIASGGAITSLGDSGSITITNSEITASSVCTSTVYETTNCGAIYAEGDISITESEVTASTNGGTAIDWYLVGAAIMSGDGSITISASKVNATADSTSNFWTLYEYDIATAIFAAEDIVISDESDITVSVTAVYGAEGIYAYENMSITESTVNATAVGDLAYAIASNTTLLIEDCDSITATVNGGTYTIGVGSTNVTITGSSVNATASTTSSSPTVFAAIDVEETATITASEIIADGGIYLYSSTGSITVAPATGGSLKITKTNASATDVSIIDTATVISTSGYTYVAITEHVHAYDYNNIAWTWTDYENVTAAVTCTDTDCDHTVTVDATVLSSTTPATCTADGETVYTAKAVFGTTEYTDIASVTISATGHSYEATVTAPTCIEKGYTTYICSVCGDTYTDNETEALGHKYEAVVTAPTCTEQGYTTHTCSVCGDSYVDTYTAALGHSYEFQYFTWSNDLKTATATFKCKTCGELYTVDATITGEGDLGISVHTATVTFEGETYTDNQLTGTSLTRVSADYTEVNEAIEKANALNASDYSNFDLVTAAIDAVNWNLNILNQELVNTYAENIEAAIANLKAYVEETVNIDEPVEDSTTETESEEEAEASEPEPETNPTTGAAVVLLPMAIAFAMSVSSKKRV